MTASAAGGGGFAVVASGPWSRIEVREVASGRRVVAEVEEVIEQAWREGLARTPGLFDGAMCRLESFAPDGNGGVTVGVSRTSYKTFYGTNLYRPELRATYGAEVMANPIGLSPALRTADGHLVFGRRNQSVAYYPGRVHPFSGALEPGEHPFDAVRRELGEELHLLPADLMGEVVLLGVVEDVRLAQPEFIFYAETRRLLSELREMLDPEEHQGIVAYDTGHPSAWDAIGLAELTPVARGTAELYRRYAAGRR